MKADVLETAKRAATVKVRRVLVASVLISALRLCLVLFVLQWLFVVAMVLCFLTTFDSSQ